MVDTVAEVRVFRTHCQLFRASRVFEFQIYHVNVYTPFWVYPSCACICVHRLCTGILYVHAAGDPRVYKVQRLSLATVFSGLETQSMAMHLLGDNHDLCCALNRASHVRTLFFVNFSTWHLYSNELGRLPRDEDVRVAGPPCVRFSIQCL